MMAVRRFNSTSPIRLPSLHKENFSIHRNLPVEFIRLSWSYLQYTRLCHKRGDLFMRLYKYRSRVTPWELGL